MIPLGTEQSFRRFPFVTTTLILVTVAVSCVIWGAGMRDPTGGGPTFENVHFQRSGEWWRAITYQFVHQDMMHLLGNMIFLWVFGPPVEDKLGRIATVVVYLGGGMVAAYVHGYFNPNPVIGASGSVATLTGAFLVLFPLVQVRVLWWFGIISLMNISARWFILLCIGKDLIFSGGHVAWMAHMGGYAAGMAVGFLAIFTRFVPRDQFDLLALGSRMKRRAEIRAVGREAPRVMAQSAPAGGFFGGKKAKAAGAAQQTLDLRVSILEHISAKSWLKASESYRQLRGMEDQTLAMRTLPRDRQLELGKGLLEAGQYNAAAQAFEDFATTFPRDPETFATRTMGCMIRVRYLNEGPAAAPALRELRQAAPDAEHQAMIDALLAESAGTPVN